MMMMSVNIQIWLERKREVGRDGGNTQREQTRTESLKNKVNGMWIERTWVGEGKENEKSRGTKGRK